MNIPCISFNSLSFYFITLSLFTYSLKLRSSLLSLTLSLTLPCSLDECELSSFFLHNIFLVKFSKKILRAFQVDSQEKATSHKWTCLNKNFLARVFLILLQPNLLVKIFKRFWLKDFGKKKNNLEQILVQPFSSRVFDSPNSSKLSLLKCLLSKFYKAFKRSSSTISPINT